MVYQIFNIDIVPKYIIEVGTHYGTEALLLEKKYNDAIINTYEADICKHKRIEDSLKNNNSNVNFHKIGLSNREEIRDFYKFTGYDNDGADSLFNRYNGEMKCNYEVPITTLKNEMEKNNIPRIDLLCMDTQGSELDILHGLGDKIELVNYIIMEIPDVIMDTTYFKIPKGNDSVYRGGCNSKDINLFLSKHNFIEIDRKRENDLESNVLFKRVEKLKFDCVLTSVNNNKLYLDYIPNFIKSWSYLFENIEIVIILIMDEIPINLIQYNQYLRLFKPLEGVDTAYIAQNIRLYYPSILNKKGVLITDIDIYPMSKKYYEEPLKGIDMNKFVIYRPLSCVESGQIAMCYCLASSKIWQKINKCSSIQDIKNNLIFKYPSNYGKYRPAPLDWLRHGWFCDQETLYKLVMDYKNYFVVGDNQFNRIDKINLTIEKAISYVKNIKSSKYSDFIPCRPDTHNYAEINDLIINSLIQ